MRGHEHFIQARLRGFKPQHGFTLSIRPVHIDPLSTVQIEPTDKPEKTDLRWVIGLGVTVWGTDLDSVMAWVNACHKAKAEYAVGCVFNSKNQVGDIFILFKTGQFVEDKA